MGHHLISKAGIDNTTTENIYAKVFRTQHEAPGYALLSFEGAMDSKRLRQYMLALKSGLSRLCQKELGEELDYCWLARFDQQETTKFHRDNAPVDSYLMLGYEPTTIASRLQIADYHQLVTEHRIPVEEYYASHNPMFKDGEEELKPYIQEVEGFDKAAYQILLLNNSDLRGAKTFGVLHKAEMLRKDPDQARVVNSMMLCLDPSDRLTREEERQFLETDEISR